MQTTGIIRKIDELGRIVLPKELRKYLNINPGDDFQIAIESERIILEKYSRLQNIETELINLINCFSSVTKNDIYLIINNKIINKENEMITNEIQNLIQERKIFYKDTNLKLKISNNIISKNKIVINPIILNSDILGTIIITDNVNLCDIISDSKILENIIKMKFM
ncbi:MAG: AbrB/MazE/SpoVT family DNA-binding domain-containing protein [Tenericutes bacterium]|nr:AbrB/MazE/SpoVT family DNA-binding domain-containing protein [Mycoplasmatota bacterium]